MNVKNISGTALMLKYRPINTVIIEQTVANNLDVVVAVITITIQYPQIDVMVCWPVCYVCVRVCVRDVRACVCVCMYV